MNNDYVHVRLTAAGIDMADGAALTVNGRTSVVFLPGQSTRVARYEWDLMLKHLHDAASGELLVELVPATSAEPPAEHKETN